MPKQQVGKPIAEIPAAMNPRCCPSYRILPQDVKVALQQLGRTDIDQIRRKFLEYDANKDGVISPSELKNVIAQQSRTFTEKTVASLLAILDINRDGKVDFAEFLALVVSSMPGTQIPRRDEAEMTRMFKEIDLNGDGRLGRHELKLALGSWGISGPAATQIMDKIFEADKDGNGKITFAEFKLVFPMISKMKEDQSLNSDV